MLFVVCLSLHIVFVVTWFAALFYLPRLFVYHAEASDSISIERFKIMERRLYKGILLPSSLLALLFGLVLVFLNWQAYVDTIWFWIKVVLILALFGYQGMASKFRKSFANDANTKSEKYFRIFNELPVLILIAVVFLVILKPF